jgi:phosphoglucosamine mutase
MSLRFGTDGIRGPADELTDGLATALGRAAARVLGGDRLLIGRDPRESGPRLVEALARGARAEGVVPVVLGVAPTPALAWLSAAEDVPAAMVSASHNVWSDNGIKVFAAGGRKLDDEVEARLEGVLAELVDDEPPVDPAAPTEVTAGATELVGRWATAVGSSIEGRRLDGLSVVLDCANGAASAVAPAVLGSLGATVEVLHASPDGRNINAGCGSTHPEELQAAVVASGAQVGLAFDGDADRVLAVDEHGELVDGDQLIALCALDRHRRGALRGDAVVVTVMTNLGFRLAMADHGIGVVETPVGDRHVLEALARHDLALGGEQSGHIVFADLATTGDGLLSGIQVLDVLARTGRSLADLAAEAMTRLPQVLRNVTVARRDPGVVARVADVVAAEEARLGPSGRVLVRASGTEPLVRVMVEAPTAEEAEAAAGRIAAQVEARAG